MYAILLSQVTDSFNHRSLLIKFMSFNNKNFKKKSLKRKKVAFHVFEAEVKIYMYIRKILVHSLEVFWRIIYKNS